MTTLQRGTSFSSRRSHGSTSTPDLPTAYQLARAFGFYFELINLAETNHRKRRRLSHAAQPATGTATARRSARDAAPPARGRLQRRCRPTTCFAASASRLSSPRIQLRSRVAASCSNAAASPTCSSSSTAFLFPNLSSKTLSAISSPRSPPCGRPTTSAARGPPSATRSAWRSTTTSPASSTRFRCSTPRLRLRCRGVPGHTTNPLQSRTCRSSSRFGSWIGGDRDGNPFVTPQATRDALAMAHSLLLTHYRRRLQNLFEQLASSTQQVPVSAAAERPARPLSHAASHGRADRAGRALPLRIRPAADRLHHDAAGSDAAVRRSFSANPALTPYTRAADLLCDLATLRNASSNTAGTVSPRC